MPRLTLHRKVLIAFLCLALIPLGLLAAYSITTLGALSGYLRNNATTALDRQAAHALQTRAENVAGEVADFLREVEGDLFDLSRLPPTASAYLGFAQAHRREIWFRTGSNEHPEERRELAPLYSELAFVDASGRERLHIQDGVVVPAGRILTDPKQTTYSSEDYILRSRILPPGKIYVSHLTGWHVGRAEQLRGAPSPEAAVEGEQYRGVIRFARPLHDAGGRLQGVVVLSLDHRHLMEFTQHVTPAEERRTLFPSYASGNYAFMFDDEGWMITHPKFWDLRGLGPDGQLIPPYRVDSSPADVAAGKIPFNLFSAGFIHANYPQVAAAVLRRESGVVDVTNVGGSRKIMAYAPIPYAGGDYERHGVFGGVTIGAQLEQFHKPAQLADAMIRKDISRFALQSGLILLATAALVLYGANRLAKNMTEPLLRLIEGTKEMARGNLATEVTIRSGDEVGELAESFNRMARELNDRNARLFSSLNDLQRSRQEILRERNFKITVFENIETGILTLDETWRVTSMTGPATRMLELSSLPGRPLLQELLCAWPELAAALSEAQGVSGEQRWSRYVSVSRDGRNQTFRLALLPLSTDQEAGKILTVEDLTDRVNLRERMARMERLVSLGRLAAGIAHEVRNPLTGIILLLDELHDRLLAHPHDQDLIRRALQEIERLEGLVNELLHFAALPQRPLELGDLVPVLQDLLYLLDKQCRKAGIVLEVQLPSELPRISMDPAKLKQAFLNVLTNALDAMPDGGRLRVSALAGTDGVQVIMTDSGEGIPDERLPLIFEPFFTSKGEGTGLGLSITHNIVSDHGGRIEVESQVGVGTVFKLWFPCAGEGVTRDDSPQF